MLKDIFIKPLITVHDMVAHASAAIRKPKVALSSHADMYVVGDKSLVIHDNNKSVNVYNYNPKDGHRSAKTVMSQ